MDSSILSRLQIIPTRSVNKGRALCNTETTSRTDSASVELTVGETVWEAVAAVGGPHVGREDELDVPVGVGAAEEVDFEVAVSADVFVFDEDGSFVLHVARG